ncbi:MAG TPA: TadE/TadG family type IV pilus assembly protein [Rhizorhapis sp.]|uniref:TadE/TadG family type IV pilus assembly protein n=1 Tax=Rhizorhapis sp. TaxID=1968842 RepID=UPI002B4614AF|nr:TadE/TadG family type IV pilus assembly protein [Rhizorhapis sp.]HKR16229.1 TadE/TadG family type IV pilus assembly protein [Rhizorhapis sp.]HKX23150.1 TadE/TadG family type IV pilus assembly protein [Rhizorhapis sp.]
MTNILIHLGRDKKAASAAEFAMVLPLLLIFLLGMLDVGRLMWTWNKAEKATQAGVRYAVATSMVSGELFDYRFTVDGGVSQGDAVPSTTFDYLICTEENDCTDDLADGTPACEGSACSEIEAVLDTNAFDGLVTRMQALFPEIETDNVVIEYKNIGLGFAGDPNGADVSPLVKVSLQNMTFHPITFMLFNGTITLPDFSAALTMEDGQGNVSN